MKISKIEKLKSGKYKLEFDDNNKIITYDDVILNNNLLFNKEISKELLNKLYIDTSFYDAYNKVVKYITTKMRSQREVEQYLSKLDIPSNEQEKIIIKLQKTNLIDDLKYIKAYINDKIYLYNYGPYKIKKELLDHNIEEKEIDKELDKYDYHIFEENLNRVLAKKVKSNKKSPYIFKQKIYQYFINLGYPKELIESCLNNYNLEDNNIIKNEYNKLKLKLEKKYNGEELIYNIKNKLYQKGFSTEQINEVLKNE